jgi:hypothetical protein
MPMLSRARSVGRRLPLVCSLTLAVSLVLACESESLKPQLPEPSELYWELTLDHRSVLLSTTPPYNTLQLVATPRNALGQPLPGYPAPEFTSTDYDRVGVTADGMLEAFAVTGQPVLIRISLTANDQTYRDSVYVSVMENTDPPVLESFSIQAESNKIPIAIHTFYIGTGPHRLKVQALDPNDAPITGMPVYFRSSDTKVARVHPFTGIITPNIMGDVTIYASTTVFGVHKEDSYQFQVTEPLAQKINQVTEPDRLGNPVSRLQPAKIQLSANGFVTFIANGKPLDIVFADAGLPNVATPSVSPFYLIGNPFLGEPSSFVYFECGILMQSDCGSGNVHLDGVTRNSATRTFLAPGTYEYHSPTNGISGRIVVVDGDS